MGGLLIRYRKIVIPILMIGAFASIFLFEAPANDFYPHWAKTLAAPIGIALFLFTYWNLDAIKRLTLGSTWEIWGTVACLYPLALLLAPMYVLAANAAVARAETVMIRGLVTEKNKFSKKPGYLIKIQDKSTGKSFDLGVTAPEFDAVKIGAEYRVCFYIGGLGIPFKWRYGENGGLCSLSLAFKDPDSQFNTDVQARRST